MSQYYYQCSNKRVSNSAYYQLKTYIPPNLKFSRGSKKEHPYICTIPSEFLVTCRAGLSGKGWFHGSTGSLPPQSMIESWVWIYKQVMLCSSQQKRKQPNWYILACFDTSPASFEVWKILVFSSVKHLSAEGSFMESCSPCSPDIDVKPNSQQLLDHSAT